MCVDAVRYDGNASDRCTAGCETVPVCLVGMAAGTHCGSVTVITTVRCVFERGRPLWTAWLTLSQHRDANYVLSLLFSCSHQMQRNSLRLKRPAVHIILPKFECSVICRSLLAFQIVGVVC